MPSERWLVGGSERSTKSPELRGRAVMASCGRVCGNRSCNRGGPLLLISAREALASALAAVWGWADVKGHRRWGDEPTIARDHARAIAQNPRTCEIRRIAECFCVQRMKPSFFIHCVCHLARLAPRCSLVLSSPAYLQFFSHGMSDNVPCMQLVVSGKRRCECWGR